MRNAHHRGDVAASLEQIRRHPLSFELSFLFTEAAHQSNQFAFPIDKAETVPPPPIDATVVDRLTFEQEVTRQQLFISVQDVRAWDVAGARDGGWHGQVLACSNEFCPVLAAGLEG